MHLADGYTKVDIQGDQKVSVHLMIKIREGGDLRLFDHLYIGVMFYIM